MVYNHTLANAQTLARQINCPYTNSIKDLPKASSVYLIALADSHILKTLNQLELNHPFLVHTSGSFDSSQLNKFTSNWGCFYPMQTFKKNQPTTLKGSSVFIESNNEKNNELLNNIAKDLDCNSYSINSKQRKQLHIAAIATNNFSYHLFSCIQQYCNKNNLPYESLNPLIEETLKKIALNEPFKHQTGPAIRNEDAVIENHLELLAEDKNLLEIYSLLSKQIKKQT